MKRKTPPTRDSKKNAEEEKDREDQSPISWENRSTSFLRGGAKLGKSRPKLKKKVRKRRWQTKRSWQPD